MATGQSTEGGNKYKWKAGGFGQEPKDVREA